MDCFKVTFGKSDRGFKTRELAVRYAQCEATKRAAKLPWLTDPAAAALYVPENGGTKPYARIILREQSVHGDYCTPFDIIAQFDKKAGGFYEQTLGRLDVFNEGATL